MIWFWISNTNNFFVVKVVFSKVAQLHFFIHPVRPSSTRPRTRVMLTWIVPLTNGKNDSSSPLSPSDACNAPEDYFCYIVSWWIFPISAHFQTCLIMLLCPETVCDLDMWKFDSQSIQQMKWHALHIASSPLSQFSRSPHAWKNAARRRAPCNY